MRSPTVTYPDARFGEDMMTAYAGDVIDGGPGRYGMMVPPSCTRGIWEYGTERQ
jgi:hypothetical protein